MNAVVQWLVVVGVWLAILVDVLGNQAGQRDAPNHDNWVPIVWGTSLVVAAAGGGAARDLCGGRRP